ncbi:hypothetical protein M0802_007517 [Mischocyttarus mexicanus]|nr:hypothetical protein M0802_007517 [Mischocyttarus mexicanus]
MWDVGCGMWGWGCWGWGLVGLFAARIDRPTNPRMKGRRTSPFSSFADDDCRMAPNYYSRLDLSVFLRPCTLI